MVVKFGNISQISIANMNNSDLMHQDTLQNANKSKLTEICSVYGKGYIHQPSITKQTDGSGFE